MKIIETHPREIGFVLWGHCKNLFDDPRMRYYKDFHRIQCTEAHPFGHKITCDNIVFLQIKQKFSIVIENPVSSSFVCKSVARRSHGGRLVGKFNIFI